MKADVQTTGIIFGLLTGAHIWRILGEELSLARNPFFVSVTAVAAGLCLWDVAVFVRAARIQPKTTPPQ